MGLPSGLVTFLFTDIERSSELFAAYPDEYPSALELHNQAIRTAIADAGGHVVSTEGDAFFVAFSDASAAVHGAAAAQRSVTAIDWPDGLTLRVRMGLHTGTAQPTSDNYVAFCVHQAARVVSAGYGGQIVLSSATQRAAIEIPPGLRVVPRGRFRLRDFPEPEHLFTVEGDGLPDEQATLRAPTERNENLPTFRTGLVGRDDELAAVSELLANSRVVTLTGLGGVGKTRTATAVATAEVPRSRDGVWFCPLDTVTDPSLVLHAVAEAMGKKLGATAGSPDDLARLVGDSNTLVVVDNCEHVLEAAAAVVNALVRDCPELRVLATSQAPLDIEGERVFRLGPLSADGDSSPALALFIERAIAAGATWTTDAQQLEAAAEIVGRLDGIPLAIELAAARAANLTPREIGERLDQRFTIIASSRRDVLPRRRALLATIEWSYELLDARDAAMLRHLSFFAGSFELPAAEAMAAALGLDAPEAVDALSTLVARSLVSFADTDEGRRYRLLDSIRAYGLQQADAHGETRAGINAHAAWVRTHLPPMNTLEDLELDPTVRGRLAARLHSDIALACDRLIDAHDPYAAEFCWRASPVWGYLMRVEEGMSRLMAAVDLADDDFHRGRCLQAAAYLAEISQLPEQAELYSAAADALSSVGATSADPVAIAFAASAALRAAKFSFFEDPARLEVLVDQATRFSERIGWTEGLAGVASIRSEIAFESRDHDAADALSREYVSLARQTKGQPYGRALFDRALYMLEFGRADEADDIFWQAVDALEGEPLQATVLRQFALARVLTGPETIPVAIDVTARAENVALQFNWIDEVLAARLLAAGLHAYAGDRASGDAIIEEALELARERNLRRVAAYCELVRCRTALMFDDVDAAGSAIHAARRHYDLPEPLATHQAAVVVRHDPERARALLATLDDIVDMTPYPSVSALTAFALGDPQSERVLAAARACPMNRSYFSLHLLRDLGAGRGDFVYPRDAREFLIAWAKEAS